MSEIKTILCPTNWSEPSERALDAAIAIAAHHGVQLLLLHVIETPDLESMSWLREEHIEKRFRKLRARKPRAQHARRLICHGVASTEITRAAIVEGADLIVMSSHGHRMAAFEARLDRARSAAPCAMPSFSGAALCRLLWKHKPRFPVPLSKNIRSLEDTEIRQYF